LFCAPGLIFDGTEGVGSHFLILRSLTRFERFRGRRVPFSCFALPHYFSAVPRASRSVFMFSATGYIFGGAEGIESSFPVLRSRTHFRRYRGRRVPFSCFELLDSFSAKPRASGAVFMFCAPELVFNGTEDVGSRFHVLRSRTRFRPYRGRPFPFSCFPLLDMISAIPSASGPVFMFCAPGLIFDGIGGVGADFMFYAPGLFFGGTEGVKSHFYVFRSLRCFRRCRGRRVPFSCFALPYSFSMVPRA
jgi:hypothetical protein